MGRKRETEKEAEKESKNESYTAKCHLRRLYNPYQGGTIIEVDAASVTFSEKYSKEEDRLHLIHISHPQCGYGYGRGRTRELIFSRITFYLY